MTRNEQQSVNADAADVGILLNNPRRYRALKSAYLLGRAARLNARLAAYAGVAPGEHAVDIGCGPGDLVRALAERVGPGGRVLGVDPAPEMIAYAGARARGTTNCRFELGSAQSLSVPDASVDLVTSTFAMHHIPEALRPTAIAHMFRVLRPGGRLLLADTHPTGVVGSTVVRVMARVARHAHEDAPDRPPTDPLATIDLRQYRDTMRYNGFEDIEFTTIAPSTGALLARKPID